MAKKEKAPEAEGEGENPAAEGAEAAPKKGLGAILGKLKSKKVLMIGAPVLVLLLTLLFAIVGTWQLVVLLRDRGAR